MDMVPWADGIRVGEGALREGNISHQANIVRILGIQETTLSGWETLYKLYYCTKRVWESSQEAAWNRGQNRGQYWPDASMSLRVCGGGVGKTA